MGRDWRALERLGSFLTLAVPLRSFASSAVKRGLCFPISAMTCDHGDCGDRRALRAHPSPLPIYPTASQVIPVWRRLQRFCARWRWGCLFRSPDHPMYRSPDVPITRQPPSPGIPPHPRSSQIGVSLRDFAPVHPTLACTSAMIPSFGVDFSVPCLCSFSQKLVARSYAAFFCQRALASLFLLEKANPQLYYLFALLSSQKLPIFASFVAVEPCQILG